MKKETIELFKNGYELTFANGTHGVVMRQDMGPEGKKEPYIFIVADKFGIPLQRGYKTDDLKRHNPTNNDKTAGYDIVAIRDINNCGTPMFGKKSVCEDAPLIWSAEQK